MSDKRRSAVLVLLSQDSVDGALLITERAAHLRHHPGQLCFPGGGREGMETAVQTALRETFEEVAIAPDEIEIIGTLSEGGVARSHNIVTSVVGVLRDESLAVRELVLDPDEVAAAKWIQIKRLASPENRATWQFETFSGPAFVIDEYVIWGYTAGVISELLASRGWDKPWDRRRIIEIPSRFIGTNGS